MINGFGFYVCPICLGLAEIFALFYRLACLHILLTFKILTWNHVIKSNPSSLAKVSICFPPLPLGGFKQFFLKTLGYFATDIARIKYLGTVWFIGGQYFVICLTCALLIYSSELVYHQ